MVLFISKFAKIEQSLRLLFYKMGFTQWLKYLNEKKFTALCRWFDNRNNWVCNDGLLPDIASDLKVLIPAQEYQAMH
jgi:hypothetical protein